MSCCFRMCVRFLEKKVDDNLCSGSVRTVRILPAGRTRWLKTNAGRLRNCVVEKICSGTRTGRSHDE